MLMPTVPNNLSLDEKQIEVLEEKGIELSSVYIIKRETLHPSAVRVDGYTNGHYVFFLEGTMSDHAMFLKYLYGQNYGEQQYAITLSSRFRGINIYGSPTEKYVMPANLVNIRSAPISPINYSS
jgi:hypothetical protein